MRSNYAIAVPNLFSKFYDYDNCNWRLADFFFQIGWSIRGILIMLPATHSMNPTPTLFETDFSSFFARICKIVQTVYLVPRKVEAKINGRKVEIWFESSEEIEPFCTCSPFYITTINVFTVVRKKLLHRTESSVTGVPRAITSIYLRAHLSNLLMYCILH